VAEVQKLENWLNNFIVNKTPSLPEGVKNFIVKITPWISLLLAIILLIGVYGLWYWTHHAKQLVNSLNNYESQHGLAPTSLTAIHHMTLLFWLDMVILSAEAAAYIIAFSGTLKRLKRGWNWLYYASLINLLYSIIIVLTGYGTFSNFLGGLLGTAISLYFLFQIRSKYKFK
jgi:hypothetical protein